MPELPEVEARRKVAERFLLGRTLLSATAARDPIVIQGVSAGRLRSRLTGRRVEAVGRRGKVLWIALDRGPWLVLHFGMGGHFETYPTSRRRPPFWKLELERDDGLRLAMTNPRRLGRVRLQEHPFSQPPLSELGPDPYLAMPAGTRFAAALAARKAPIKAVLLDQAFLAGIGNWIADEVLYQARIAPTRPAATLRPEETDRLRTRIVSVIRRAVAVDAESKRFPRSWLFHVRWGKDAQARTRDGKRLAFTEVGGRTTAWVPGVQR